MADLYRLRKSCGTTQGKKLGNKVLLPSVSPMVKEALCTEEQRASVAYGDPTGNRSSVSSFFPQVIFGYCTSTIDSTVTHHTGVCRWRTWTFVARHPRVCRIQILVRHARFGLKHAKKAQVRCFPKFLAPTLSKSPRPSRQKFWFVETSNRNFPSRITPPVELIVEVQ